MRIKDLLQKDELSALTPAQNLAVFGKHDTMLCVDGKHFRPFDYDDWVECRKLKRLGYRMLGFVQGPATDDTTIDSQEIAGTIDDLPELMATSPVHELILVPDPECHEETIRILYSLYHYKCPIKNIL